MKAVLALVFLAVAAFVVDNATDTTKQAAPRLGPDLTSPQDVADVVAAGAATAPHVAQNAAPGALLVWAWFIAAGVVAGIVYAVAAGTLADRYPRQRWAIWAALAGGSITAWVLAGQFAVWFNAVSGAFVMIGTVLVMDFAFGGPHYPATQPRRPTVRHPQPRDESWRDVIPPEVVIQPQRGDSTPMQAGTPTWRDLQRMSWQVQRNVSVVALAATWGTTPETIAQWVRDYRLAEDRWEDTLAGRPVAPAPSVREAGRDLADEIHDTGWDAFLAAAQLDALAGYAAESETGQVQSLKRTLPWW